MENALSAWLDAQERGAASRLAKTVGVSRQMIADLKAGRRQPSIGIAIKIAQATDDAVPVTSWEKAA